MTCASCGCTGSCDPCDSSDNPSPVTVLLPLVTATGSSAWVQDTPIAAPGILKKVAVEMVNTSGVDTTVSLFKNGVAVPGASVTFPSSAVDGAMMNITKSVSFQAGDKFRLVVTATGGGAWAVTGSYAWVS